MLFAFNLSPLACKDKLTKRDHLLSYSKISYYPKTLWCIGISMQTT